MRRAGRPPTTPAFFYRVFDKDLLALYRREERISLACVCLKLTLTSDAGHDG